MEQLKIVIVGHVDHGKSTLVGRLLHDTGTLPQGKLEELQAVARRRGVPFEWANLMDALQAERDQNITIDTAQIWFRTAHRHYVIIDAPGHKEFLKNMVTGAAQADAALLLIDAREGIQEQSQRHGYLLHLLGVRQLTVLINKMDQEDYSADRFARLENEYRSYLARLGLEGARVIPISARHGDNIAALSANMPWWTGPTVVQALDQIRAAPSADHLPLRFAVQDVYRFDERRIVAGRVESGRLQVGDRLLFSPGNKTSAVRSIERWHAPQRDEAVAGESIGLTLEEPIFVERGALASLESSPPYVLSSFKARLFWMGHADLRPGRAYKLKLATQEVECEVESIEAVIDASTLERIRPSGEFIVRRYQVAELTLRTRRPLALDSYDQIVPTGRFVMVDGLDVAGGGVVVDDHYPPRWSQGQPKSENIFWSQSKVSPLQRARRNRHQGCVVWLTGLSGSGKSSIATELERRLFEAGKQAYVLDGDNVRHGLCSDLGFSAQDRQENIRRVGEVAALFAEAGLICITAFISPYRRDRDRVRQTMLQRGLEFVEVFLDTPLSVCEQRDSKGLYARARALEIKDFTGISSPYEEPLGAEIVLSTEHLTVPQGVARVLDHLQRMDDY